MNELERLYAIERAAKAVVTIVRQTHDHEKWFPALAALMIASDTSSSAQETRANWTCEAPCVDFESGKCKCATRTEVT